MPTTDPSRSRDYIAWMQCTAEDEWLPRAREQVQSWLREKHFDVDLSEWADHTVETSMLKVRPLPPDRGQDLHVELAEQSPLGTWTTTMVLHDAPGSDADWISLTVANDQGRYVKVPRIAKYLMQVLPLGDGTLDFLDKPQILGFDDVDRLVRAVEDPERHGLLFVAGTAHADIPFDAFAEKVGQWSREVAGLAEVVVLDPAATTRFQEEVGADFATAPWTIRTYHPAADLRNPLDARRHRFMTTGRLATQHDGAITHLLGDIARQQAATRLVDPELTRVRRRLRRIETGRLVDALEKPLDTTPVIEPIKHPSTPTKSASPPETTVESTELLELRQIVDTVRLAFSLTDITPESLMEISRSVARREADQKALMALRTKVDEMQVALEDAEDVNAELITALEDAQLDAEISRIDADDHKARIGWLESQLKDQGVYDVAYLDVPAEFYESRPRSFSELLDRVEQLDAIEFTGEATEVERLNQVDTNDAALRTAWDAVLTLNDYARARKSGACDQGLEHYIAHTPSGYTSIPPGKFGATETRETMRHFGEERVFPVPVDVDPSGKAVMKAHFKLARIGMISPRMYVYDCHPAQSRVIIGYIGPHLTNTHTR